MWNLKKWLLNNKLIVIGAIVGAIGGYLYYCFIGCASGSCAITSKPINSMLYFSIMGGVVASIIKPNTDKAKENEIE